LWAKKIKRSINDAYISRNFRGKALKEEFWKSRCRDGKEGWGD
jgi:hypothetical protein